MCFGHAHLRLAFFFFFFLGRSAFQVWQWVPCTIHKTHKSLFSTKLSLKINHTALFTHLKIILLQYFQFSVKLAVSKCTLTNNFNYMYISFLQILINNLNYQIPIISPLKKKRNGKGLCLVKVFIGHGRIRTHIRFSLDTSRTKKKLIIFRHKSLTKKQNNQFLTLNFVMKVTTTKSNCFLSTIYFIQSLFHRTNQGLKKKKKSSLRNLESQSLFIYF